MDVSNYGAKVVQVEYKSKPCLHFVEAQPAFANYFAKVSIFPQPHIIFHIFLLTRVSMFSPNVQTMSLQE